MTTKRRRGIYASPQKLQKALAASGLKTQTAVAEQIADNENLDTAPRGSVNKTFRGEQVDPRSIERIALALGVEAWTLYANSDEQPIEQPSKNIQPATTMVNPSPAKPKHNRRIQWILISALFALLVIVGLLRSFLPPKQPQIVASDSTQITIAPRAEQPTVSLISINDQLSINELATALDQYWRVLPGSWPSSTDPLTLLNEGSAETIVTARTQTLGRWMSVSLFVHWPNRTQLTWQGLLPVQVSAQQLQHEMQTAAHNIATHQVVTDLQGQAHDKVLMGRYYLDLSRSEANVRRALTEFESALRHDNQKVIAYAGLCEALVQENIRTGAISRLSEAQAQCEQALKLAPDSLDAIRVQGFLDRKQGNLDAAEQHFQQVLSLIPNHVDALLGIAEVYLTQYQLGQGQSAYDKALAAVQRAYELEPNFWKTAYTLARAIFFSGKIDQVVEIAKQAASADANLNTLSNLGTYQFCAGNFNAAKDSFEQLRQIEPLSFIGEQQLSSVYYHLGDFEQAAIGFKKALKLHQDSGAAEDHRIWGNYADALRRNQAYEASIQAYRKAIALAEQNLSDGDNNPLHRVARVYYEEMLLLLAPDRFKQNNSDSRLIDELTESIDPRLAIYLAYIHLKHGNKKKAKRFSEVAAGGCPGVLQSPDLLDPQTIVNPST